jgi:hypothetical protein
MLLELLLQNRGAANRGRSRFSSGLLGRPGYSRRSPMKRGVYRLERGPTLQETSSRAA